MNEFYLGHLVRVFFLFSLKRDVCVCVCVGGGRGSILMARSTTPKMKFSIKDFFSKCDQIRRFLKKSLMENFIFQAVVRGTCF